jgi:hypothetical protein
MAKPRTIFDLPTYIYIYTHIRSSSDINLNIQFPLLKEYTVSPLQRTTDLFCVRKFSLFILRIKLTLYLHFFGKTQRFYVLKQST